MAKLQLPDKILTRLKTDPQYRLELAAKYEVTMAIPHGELLISSEYGYQTLQFKNNQWIREKDGVTQLFDNEGRLIKQTDKNGFYFTYKYSPTQRQLLEISDQDKSMSLKFVWRAERITEIIDNRGHRSRYTYDSSNNLIAVTDSNNQAFAYRYETKRYPHLLTRIDYLTESIKEKMYRELRYDDNGLVLYHRDKDGSEVNYSYGKGSNDPENNFWTKSIKKYKGINEEEYDEYLVKNRPDGSKYLYKQETRLNRRYHHHHLHRLLRPALDAQSQRRGHHLQVQRQRPAARKSRAQRRCPPGVRIRAGRRSPRLTRMGLPRTTSTTSSAIW